LLLACLIAAAGPLRFFGTIASDEADSASPELQRIDAPPSQKVSGAEQDGRADQNRQCHHSSSFSESSFVLLICFQN
jgi:hypothetical protein